MSRNPLAPSWLELPVDANALAGSVWSQNAERADSGEIVIAGVTATDIADRFGTPVYVVDENDARARARGIRDS